MTMERELERQYTNSRDKLAGSVRDLAGDAQALLRNTADTTSEELESARARLSAQLDRAVGLYRDLEASARQQYREASAQTDAYVRDNPWRSVGIAAAIGVIVGLLAVRR